MILKRNIENRAIEQCDTMTEPKVGIVILNWNGIEDTLECLKSVFSLRYKNFEVVVVDNGSIDDSTKIIPKEYPSVSLIENHTNLGYTGGNNIGMKHALNRGADYVWLLNNDTVVEKNTLDALIDEAGKKDDVGLISPLIYHYYESTKVQYGVCYANVDKFNFIHVPEKKEANSFLKNKIFVMVGAALLIKKDVIESIGFLNEKYFAYFEDLEYSVRAHKKGFKASVCVNAKILHKESASTGSKNAPFQVFLRTRNEYFFWSSINSKITNIYFTSTYIAKSIGYAADLRKQKLIESSDACLDGLWSGITKKYGAKKDLYMMPSVLRVLFMYHPYFWKKLFEWDLKGISKEIRIRTLKSAANA